MPTPLSQKDLEDIHSILNTKAWDNLVEGFQEHYDGCNQLVGVHEVRDMYTRQGQMMILQELIGLKETMREQIESAPV